MCRGCEIGATEQPELRPIQVGVDRAIRHFLIQKYTPIVQSKRSPRCTWQFCVDSREEDIQFRELVHNLRDDRVCGWTYRPALPNRPHRSYWAGYALRTSRSLSPLGAWGALFSLRAPVPLRPGRLLYALRTCRSLRSWRPLRPLRTYGSLHSSRTLYALRA